MKRTFALIAVLGLSAMLVLAAGCSQSDQEAHAEGTVENQPMMGGGAEYEGKVVASSDDCTGDCTEECMEACMAENAKRMPADEAKAMCAEQCAGETQTAMNEGCEGCPRAKAAAAAAASKHCAVCDCGKEIEGTYSMDHEGVTFYFCSESCRNAFADDPGKYMN
jgi:YHS domain-containing protein